MGQTMAVVFGVKKEIPAYFNTILFPPIAAIRWTRGLLRGSEPPITDFEDNRPGVLNDVCRTLFAFERHLIGRLPLPFGVSLLGIADARALG